MDAGMPESDVRRLRRWCSHRIPGHVEGQVRIECEVSGRYLTIVECRPAWQPELGADWTRQPVARLRFVTSTRRWMLQWPDRRGRWHNHDVAPTPTLQELIDEIEADPTGIFWG